MDRLAQTALSAIRQMQDLKYDLAHNLANVNVPGFRHDLPNEGNAGFLKTLDQASAKVLPLETDTRLFSSEMGRRENTGVETDIAVLNEGYFYIQPESGQVALSRRGDYFPNTISSACRTMRYSTKSVILLPGLNLVSSSLLVSPLA